MTTGCRCLFQNRNFLRPHVLICSLQRCQFSCHGKHIIWLFIAEFLLFFKQISRLTWFTRLDPVVPKQSVVESIVGTLEMKKSSEDGEFHRKGTSPIWNSVCTWSEFDIVELALPLPDSSSSVPAQPRWKSALYWLCGMERRKDGGADPAPPAENACSLEEKRHLKHIVNVNLIICLSGAVFLIGYWAWRVGGHTSV